MLKKQIPSLPCTLLGGGSRGCVRWKDSSVYESHDKSNIAKLHFSNTFKFNDKEIIVNFGSNNESLFHTFAGLFTTSF